MRESRTSRPRRSTPSLKQPPKAYSDPWRLPLGFRLISQCTYRRGFVSSILTTIPRRLADTINHAIDVRLILMASFQSSGIAMKFSLLVMKVVDRDSGFVSSLSNSWHKATTPSNHPCTEYSGGPWLRFIDFRVTGVRGWLRSIDFDPW